MTDQELRREVAAQWGLDSKATMAPQGFELEWCESGYCDEHEEHYNAYMVLVMGEEESQGMAYLGDSGEVW